MTSIANISCVIIAKNAAATLGETLKSLQGFEDVVLYSNNSTDDTNAIARSYENVNLVEGDFLGFGPTKNKACEYATNDWILSLDSDEVLSLDLFKELYELELNQNTSVFQIKRDNYFLDKKVNFSGWGNDYLVRLFNQKMHKFNNNLVHEFVELNSYTKIKKLQSSFKHNAVLNINDFLYKIATYSDLASQNKHSCSFLIVILKAKWTFIKIYFLQLGFLDGWRGFFIAYTSSYSKFFRYIKRYINCNK